MKTNQNKILIIVLIVIAILAIAGGAFAYIFFCTDMLKSGQELFAKYLTQNVDELTQTLNMEKLNEIEKKIKDNKYEENITVSYLEAEETESYVEIAIDTQNDPINKKYYGILGLSMVDLEEPLQIEYMIDEDMYSLRFTNIIKQFLTIENVNLKQLATNLGVNDEEVLEIIPDTIDFEQFSFAELALTDEEKNTEIEKYINLIYNNISKEKYTKVKNTVITLNGKTITTNAYVLTLNMQEVKTLTLKLLEELKKDEILLAKLEVLDEKIQEYSEESIKDSYVEALQEAIDELDVEDVTEEKLIITVYEEKGKTVRIKAEQSLDSITLDTTEVEGKKQIDLNYTSIDEENTQLSNKVTLIKENDNKLNITITNIDGEEQESNECVIELSENENNTKIEFTVSTDGGKIIISEDIYIVEEIDYKVTLDNTNNIILNNLSSEQILMILSSVGERLATGYIEPLQEALLPLMLMTDMYDIDLSEAELAVFNTKFEIYEGTNIATMQINELLNTVYLHNQQEAINQTEYYVTVSGDITLEANATEVMQLEGENKYTVECIKNENGLIDKILITKNEALIDLVN